MHLANETCKQRPGWFMFVALQVSFAGNICLRHQLRLYIATLAISVLLVPQRGKDPFLRRARARREQRLLKNIVYFIFLFNLLILYSYLINSCAGSPTQTCYDFIPIASQTVDTQ